MELPNAPGRIRRESMRYLLSVAYAVCMIGSAQGTMAQTASTAPPTDIASHVSADELQDVLQRAGVGPDGKPVSLSKRLFTTGSFSTSFIRLNEPDMPKVHGVWSELFVVQQGSGFVQTGGTITGTVSNDAAAHRGFFVDPVPARPQSETEVRAAAARREAQGDKSGTEQEGGVMQHVVAGDLVLIPAGIPHRWVRIDEPVVYLAIKFPKDAAK